MPCAILLDVAAALESRLRASNSVSAVAPLAQLAARISCYYLQTATLQLIFFDGEEAFVTWTADDSLYGTRHLAAKWAMRATKAERSDLEKIAAFVLLDLLGDAHPSLRHTAGHGTTQLFARARATGR